MNQKAEAVLISNGISMEGFTAKPLTNEDITPNYGFNDGRITSTKGFRKL